MTAPGPLQQSRLTSARQFCTGWPASRSQQAAPASSPRRRRLLSAAATSSSSSSSSRPGSSDAKRVVLTGGTRGLGFAMAREFLAAGDSVVICGRDAGSVAAAVAALAAEHGDGRVHGTACDVSSPADMQRFGDLAAERLGGVDLWLNNAGEVTAKRPLLTDVEPAELVRVVGTNVTGSLLGCQQALRLMRAQPAGEAGQPCYHIFNFGFSKWGAKFTRSVVTHKATKRALTQAVESLAADLQEAGVTSVGVHNLSPGMLLTDLLLRDSTPATRRLFNALAEEPETVAAALVPRVRAVRGTATSIDYLNPADAALRMLRGLPQILNGGRFFDKEGRRVAAPGQRYQANGVRVQLPAEALKK